MLHIRGRVLLRSTLFLLMVLTPAFAQTQSAVAGTPAIHCSDNLYRSSSNTRMLASASTTSNIKCLKTIRHISSSKLTFYKNHRWLLAPHYKKWWHVPSPKRRSLALKARTEVRLYTALLDKVEVRIQALTGPSWCTHLYGNRALGCRMAYAFWPSEGEWQALDTLWERESHWSTHADNPKSDACGIPQAMNNCSYGYDPSTQIRWGINYILTRPGYGTPSRALSHSNQVGWY